MKNLKKNCFALVSLVAFAFLFAACSDDKDDKHCDADAPYYCSTAKGCCAYQYNDGHGTCFSSMESCRRGGYACEVCHIED